MPVAVEANPPETKTKPMIIGVLGAKGGVGATSAAVNLAAAIAINGKHTTILDANFQQPDAAQLFGVEPEHSLMEMLNRAPHIDKQLFEACCTAATSSKLDLSLLSPPIDGEAALKANLSQLAECLKLMHCYSDFWVIDLPRHLDKHLVMLTDQCDKILLVFEATLAGVAGCRRWLNLFNQLGYDQHKIICLLNRSGSKHTDVEKQLPDCFVDETIFRLPNAAAASWDSSTRGVPLILAQPNHKYAKAIFKLAQHIMQTNVLR